MLEEIELLVARGGPEVVSFVTVLLGGRPAVLADDDEATFFPEGRISEDNVVMVARRARECVSS